MSDACSACGAPVTASAGTTPHPGTTLPCVTITYAPDAEIRRRVEALTEQQRVELIGPLMAGPDWRMSLLRALGVEP